MRSEDSTPMPRRSVSTAIDDPEKGQGFVRALLDRAGKTHIYTYVTVMTAAP